MSLEPTLTRRSCVECGATFYPKRRDAQFCSPRCRVRANRSGGGAVTDRAAATAWTRPVTLPPAMVCHCVDCRTRLAVGRAYWTLVIEQTIADLAGRDSTATEPIQHEYLHARCDYCGTIFPLDGSRHGVTLDWVETEMLDDGRVIATTGIYCSKPCGEYASSRAGTVRG